LCTGGRIVKRELSSRTKVVIAIVSSLLLVGIGFAHMRYQKAKAKREMGAIVDDLFDRPARVE
jgi:hypothetical protein